MAQTTYNNRYTRAFAGLGARDVPAGVRTALNEEASAVPNGVGVKKGTAERTFANLAANTDDFFGVTLQKHRSTDLDGTVGAPADKDAPVMEKGDIWVSCEEAIALGDRVFCRAVAAGAEVPGEFRNDADGVAQVDTLTPTAANNTEYTLNILVHSQGVDTLYGFTVTSDGTATATEICDAFRTGMAADSAFDALIDSTGTTTLILTANATDTTFEVTDVGAGVMAIAHTTASAPDCIELPKSRAEWVSPSVTGADGETVALLRLK